MKELIRDVEEEEVIILLKQMVEDNQKILELQEQLVVVVRMDAERKGRKQNRKYIRRGYEKDKREGTKKETRGGK